MAVIKTDESRAIEAMKIMDRDRRQRNRNALNHTGQRKTGPLPLLSPRCCGMERVKGGDANGSEAAGITGRRRQRNNPGQIPG